jgi:carboxymethylenebutenolidase
MPDLVVPYFTVTPASPPPWPGVLVIHEGNGMSPQLLRLCERLGREGYAVAAPDLFFRSGGPEAAGFATLIGALQREEVLADLAAAHAHLRALGATAIGITGFCMGGTITYRAALSDLELGAAAPFYGGQVAQELGEPKCPVLLFFGGQDEYIPATAIDAVRAHHAEQVVVYPDAGHGFMRDGSSNFDEPAADDAWGLLLAFFAEHLR